MAELYWPFDSSLITEGFGRAAWRISKTNPTGLHDGIDFGVPQGTELRATVAGKVRNNDAGQTDGAGVDITTDDGWMVRHWHVSEFIVPNGSRVEAGQVIARSGGAKGTWGAGFSTGAHLHWGTRVGSNWVDPQTLNPKQFGQSTKEEESDVKQISFNGRRYLIGPGTLIAFPSGDGLDELYGSCIELGTDYGPGHAMNRVCRMNGIPDEVWHKVGGSPNTSEGSMAWIAGVGYYTVTQLPPSISGFANLQINTDAIAQAIADKINSGIQPKPDITTKAEILSAIEANYPEGA